MEGLAGGGPALTVWPRWSVLPAVEGHSYRLPPPGDTVTPATNGSQVLVGVPPRRTATYPVPELRLSEITYWRAPGRRALSWLSSQRRRSTSRESWSTAVCPVSPRVRS